MQFEKILIDGIEYLVDFDRVISLFDCGLANVNLAADQSGEWV